MVKKIFRVLFGICLILFGASLYLYPVAKTEQIHKETVSYKKKVDKEYTKNKKEHRNKESDAFYQQIKKYNEDLYKNGQKDFVDAFSYTWFPIPLDGFKDEKCGYIKIPAMDVELPLYVRATEENMAKGATVLGNTSLPIGGKNTNAVIAGHRGYHGAPYFREIEKLKVGDKVYIKNPWEKLTYIVKNIKIVYPDDSDEVRIQPGKDMITLLTCHPYRSHGRYRYLVFCERDTSKKESDSKKTKQKNAVTTKDETIVYESSTPDIKREDMVRKGACLFIFLCILWLVLPRLFRWIFHRKNY